MPRPPPAAAAAADALLPVLLHFDCFYAAVFEHHHPALKHLPLAVQQKHIVVTCNYEARKRGLRKLQLISEAKRLCPDLVIVLGEDLSRFRNASKQLYAFLRSFSWNARCERLGFDEVFMDVTDLVDFNLALLNHSHLAHSFFHLSKSDPAAGFPFDATAVAGYAYPAASTIPPDTDPLAHSSQLRLVLASHLAHHMRLKLESDMGYTATAGIATNKLLCKLVGNLHKPNSQTTLLPPCTSSHSANTDHVTSFLDDYEIGKIPGIGFKIAQKLRAHVLPSHADVDSGLVNGGAGQDVRVHHVRNYPGMGPGVLENILGGPGAPNGIGARIWGLLNGRDDAQVGQAREIPRQISIEDSYRRLDTFDGVVKELRLLAKSLLARMHTDLVEDDEEPIGDTAGLGTASSRRWVAHPKTLRLSTRPRLAQAADGSRERSFARISKSAPMPGFVFNLKDKTSTVAERLVNETLTSLFRQLHPSKCGWDLSLINVAATNMADAASEKGGIGRDISKMFKHQDTAVKQRQILEVPETANTPADRVVPRLLKSNTGSEDTPTPSQEANIDDVWESDGGDQDMTDVDWFCCDECGAEMPLFAMGAHKRWHAHAA